MFFFSILRPGRTAGPIFTLLTAQTTLFLPKDVPFEFSAKSSVISCQSGCE